MSEIIWDLALIQKYNQSGPRYTSYPTALEFNESYTNEDFIAAANRYPERPLSLYVHIPFCHKLCYFCGCNKVITRHQHKADIYLDYLEKEIKARSELFKNRVATQVHWGGGTPTYLTEEQSARLMKMLKDHLRLRLMQKLVLRWTHAKLSSTCLIIYAILVLTELAWVYKISIKRFKKR